MSIFFVLIALFVASILLMTILGPLLKLLVLGVVGVFLWKYAKASAVCKNCGWGARSAELTRGRAGEVDGQVVRRESSDEHLH